MHSQHFPDAFYRVSVKGLYVANGMILLLHEPEKLSGQWELPGGGLDFGETPRDGLRREEEEELKLRVVSVSEKPVYSWTSRFENRRNMDWFYALVLTYRIELESLDFTPTDECDALALYSPEELQDLDIYHQSAPLREYFNPKDFL